MNFFMIQTMGFCLGLLGHQIIFRSGTKANPELAESTLTDFLATLTTVYIVVFTNLLERKRDKWPFYPL